MKQSFMQPRTDACLFNERAGRSGSWLLGAKAHKRSDRPSPTLKPEGWRERNAGILNGINTIFPEFQPFLERARGFGSTVTSTSS